jgi:ABC-type nitrate/sulfonate/bicarbonate transport system substrate-binding protein
MGPRWLIVLTCLLLGGSCRHVPEAKSGALRYFDLINLDVRDIPLLVALDDLASSGYKVEKVYMASSSVMADALVRGDAHIAMINNQTAWMAAAKGAPIRTIASFSAATTVLAAKASIRSCAGLHGRPIGVAATGKSFSPILFDSYLEKNCPGVKPNLLVIPQSSARTAALLSGEVDAILIPGEEFLKVQLDSPGKFHAILNYATEFPNAGIDAYQVNRDWARANAGLVKDFLRALLLAQRRLSADSQLLIDESVKRLSIDKRTAKTIAEDYVRMGIWDPNGGLTPDLVQETLSLLISHGALDSTLKPAAVADLSYLNSVLKEIGQK